jgi:toxin ParE1/3/4
MKLLVLPEAQQDATRHWHYIAQHNFTAAERFLEALASTYEAIRREPGIGHEEGFRRRKGIRSWRVDAYPRYLIFYRTSEDAVEIIRVLHGMRNLPKFFR